MTKAERLAKAERDHEKFLKRVGYTGTKSYRAPFPSYKCEDRGLPPTSDVICAIVTKSELAKQERIERSKKYTVAPAYNKSGYMVISKNDVKDIGR